MMKPEPNEDQIQRLMESLSLQYDDNPINRIGAVLEMMESINFRERNTKADYDL